MSISFNKSDLNWESLNGKDQLFVKRFSPSEQQSLAPILLIHGSIENGKIFYSKNDKGLAPYLASKGFDVFVPDLRGRGKSTPEISKHSEFGLRDMILEDFPVYTSEIKKIHPNSPIHMGSHSWGGVLIMCYLARNPDFNCGKLVFLATKRRISVCSLRKLYMINLMWNLGGKYLCWKHGFLPAKQMNFGADNESKGTFTETTHWVKEKSWIDEKDGFDYHQNLVKIRLPPVLSLTGGKDHVLGNPKDVQIFIEECGFTDSEIKVLSKRNGNMENYDHISIMTSKKASSDHFEYICSWLLIV